MPTGVFPTYILHIEHLTLEIEEQVEEQVGAINQYFDPRILPNLKVLNLVDTFGDNHERSNDRPIELDEWLDVLRGRNNSFLPDECVAQSQSHRANFSSRPSRLTELALSVRPYTFKVLMHCTSRLTFDVYSELPDGTELHVTKAVTSTCSVMHTRLLCPVILKAKRPWLYA